MRYSSYQHDSSHQQWVSLKNWEVTNIRHHLHGIHIPYMIIHRMACPIFMWFDEAYPWCHDYWGPQKDVDKNIFFFHPYLGKWSNLTNIFQMGWNHQLEKLQQISQKKWDYQIIWMLDMKNVCTNLLIYDMEKGGFCLTKDILNLLTFLFCLKLREGSYWYH